MAAECGANELWRGVRAVDTGERGECDREGEGGGKLTRGWGKTSEREIEIDQKCKNC